MDGLSILCYCNVFYVGRCIGLVAKTSILVAISTGLPFKLFVLFLCFGSRPFNSFEDSCAMHATPRVISEGSSSFCPMSHLASSSLESEAFHLISNRVLKITELSGTLDQPCRVR